LKCRILNTVFETDNDLANIKKSLSDFIFVIFLYKTVRTYNNKKAEKG